MMQRQLISPRACCASSHAPGAATPQVASVTREANPRDEVFSQRTSRKLPLGAYPTSGSGVRLAERWQGGQQRIGVTSDEESFERTLKLIIYRGGVSAARRVKSVCHRFRQPGQKQLCVAVRS
jgi:hypothetical protein